MELGAIAIAVLTQEGRCEMKREVFSVEAHLGALNGKPYVNLPDGRGYTVKFYLNFPAEEGQEILVSIGPAPKRRAGAK